MPYPPTFGAVLPPVFPAVGSGLPWDSSDRRSPLTIDLTTAGTFTRGSEGSVLTAAPTDGSTPFISWVASGSRRVGYLGLLLEGSRTNLIAYSSDLSQATSWITFGTAPTLTGSLASPDGNSTAYRVNGVSGAGIAETSGTNNAATPIAVSMWCRATSGTQTPNSNLFRAIEGRIGTTVSETTTYGRIIITGTSGGPQVHSLVPVDGRDQSGVGGVVAGARDVRVWCAQREDSAGFASSAIRTSGASATRAADILTISSFPASYLTNGGAFTFAPICTSAEMIAANADFRLLQVGTNDYVRLRNNAGTVKLELVCGGSVVASLSPTFTSRDLTLSIRYSPSSGTITLSGATSGNGTNTGSGTAWPSGTLCIGADNSGTNNAYGHFSTTVTP